MGVGCEGGARSGGETEDTREEKRGRREKSARGKPGEASACSSCRRSPRAAQVACPTNVACRRRAILRELQGEVGW